MAGAGYKSWVDGDILSAGDVNNYLMQQAVMVFADASARTSAIAAPSEGMVTYLTGTDVIEYYDGAAWQPILDQDIIEAKGDLIVGTADDTVSRLPVGTDGYFLIADSAETTGLKWSSGLPGGKVLQVVQNSYSTSVNITTSTYTDTGLNATITPTSATSTILAIVNQGINGPGGSAAFNVGVRIVRDATTIFTHTRGINAAVSTGTIAVGGIVALSYLDSPATTSALTYKTQFAVLTGSGTATAQNNNQASVLTLVEIGA